MSLKDPWKVLRYENSGGEGEHTLAAMIGV